MKTNKEKGRTLSSEVQESVTQTQTIAVDKIVIKPWLKDLVRPRTESEQANLTADISENGLTTPIILTTFDGEDNCLVDGHGRLESYLKLGKSDIPYEVIEFKNKDEISAWVYRKQLGRRNLTKQDRVYLIGSLPDSRATLVKQFETSDSQIKTYRRYARAVNWLVGNEGANKAELLDSTIEGVINLYKEATEQIEPGQETDPPDNSIPTKKVKPKFKVAKSTKEKFIELAIELKEDDIDYLFLEAINWIKDNRGIKNAD